MSVLVAADGRSRGRGACGWWLEGGLKMVGVGLRSGCIVVEFALRLPRGGCPSALCASRDSRTIQRDGRDAGNEVAQTERGAFRSSSLGDKLHPCQSIASRLAIARGICARFSASGGRLASLVDSAPAGQMRRAAGCDFHKDGGGV